MEERKRGEDMYKRETYEERRKIEREGLRILNKAADGHLHTPETEEERVKHLRQTCACGAVRKVTVFKSYRAYGSWQIPPTERSAPTP